MDYKEVIVHVSGSAVSSRMPEADAVGPVMSRLPIAVRDATSLEFRRTSRRSGPVPTWLRRASDVRLPLRNPFDRDGNDAIIIRFLIPRLGDAARQLYNEPTFFDDLPDAKDTGFDLLGRRLADVAARAMESEHIDQSFLNRISKLEKPLFGAGLDSLTLEVGQRPRLDRTVVELAKEMSRRTPRSRRVRIAGTLDMLSHSDRLFKLAIGASGQVRGIWHPGSITDLKDMLGQRVVVDGIAVFRPSERVLRIDANAMRPAKHEDMFFARLPQPVRRLDVRQVTKAQSPTTGINAIFGIWPGDESEAELLRELKTMG